MNKKPSAKKVSTVMAVDDEGKNLRLIEALLEPRGYKVIKAHGGIEAIERIKQLF